MICLYILVLRLYRIENMIMTSIIYAK